ncbi:hypothetical protein H0H93_009408, partial [Arthromyces matolae]
MSPTAKSNLKALVNAISPWRNSPRNNVVVTPVTSAGSASAAVPAQPQSGTSRGDLALEAAIPALRLTAAIADGILVAGGPLKGVVNSLLAVLDVIDKNRQNKDDIRYLQSRQLADIGKKLCEAVCMPKRRFQAVAEIIKGCRSDIDDYIQEYHTIAILLFETKAMSITRDSAMTLCVYLVDAMGHKHSISINMTQSFEQFTYALKALYTSASERGSAHHRYLDSKQYHLALNNSQRPMGIENDHDLRELVQPGTTVVMSIFVPQLDDQYCPVCHMEFPRKSSVQYVV